MSIVFLGGIHASGKDYLIEEIASYTLTKMLKASTLINHTGFSKQVDSIDKNQDILLQNLKQIIKPNQNYILNGHYCLLDKNKQITPIDENIFKAINPTALYLKEADAVVIYNRLCDRNDNSWTLSLVKKMLAQEKLHATYLAKTLNKPLKIIKDNQSKLFLHQTYADFCNF